jgi:hypothetical protein
MFIKTRRGWSCRLGGDAEAIFATAATLPGHRRGPILLAGASPLAARRPG